LNAAGIIIILKVLNGTLNRVVWGYPKLFALHFVNAARIRIIQIITLPGVGGPYPDSEFVQHPKP
jgi:hypothetical protein